MDVLAETFPFGMPSKSNEIIIPLSLPQVSHNTLAQVPPSEETLLLKRLRMIRNCLEGMPNQEVSWCKHFDAIIIVVGNNAQGAAVEACLYSSQHSAHFFKIKLVAPHSASQMSLEAFHSCLP